MATVINSLWVALFFLHGHAGTKEKTKHIVQYVSLLFVTGLLTYIVQWKAPLALAANVELQLFTLEENSQRVNEFPFGKKYVIALVSQTEDLTKFLPITLTVKHSRVTATDRIPNDPAKYCKDIHVCALPGPMISPKGTQTAIEITAKGNDDKTLATFSQGALPSDSSNQTTSIQTDEPTLPAEVKSLRGEPAPPLIQDPIFDTLSGLALISVLGFIFSLRKHRRAQ